jgi:signal transduction histidine kinase
MMHDFLANNREELAKRCRVKVGERPGRDATDAQLLNGIPMFLEQLIRTLKSEITQPAHDTDAIAGPADGSPSLSEVSVTAGQHGKDLLALGLSVDQVVHDYGDLCQAITDLAMERDKPFAIEEFRTLNRCLDNAISDAVTEFSYQRDVAMAAQMSGDLNQRMGFLAHELRNHLGTASLAFSAAQAGNLGLSGATGTILARSLQSLEKLIAISLEEVRQSGVAEVPANLFSLAAFIDDTYAAAALSARGYGCTLRAEPVDADLGVSGNRDLLMAALANLIQNAFKFTKSNTEVLLTAYGAGDRILIDVKDHCGGLPPGAAEDMFRPFFQGDANRSGIGLGLTITRQSVTASGGTVSTRDVPGVGCVFTISLPRYAMPT